MTKNEALKMAIEKLEEMREWSGNRSIDPTINACKEALEQEEQPKSKGSKYLDLIDLESEFPFAKWEREMLIKKSMECLLEEGELGKLGLLLHRFEETVRYFENRNPVKEYLKELNK